MFLNLWRRWLNPRASTLLKEERRNRQRLGRGKFRPNLEGLECRVVPTITFTKTANAASFAAGQNITYTLQVHLTQDPSQDPIDDNFVQISDVLPANTTFVSAAQDPADPTQFTPSTPPAGTNGTVQWTTPTLPLGETDTFTLVVNINPAAGTGTITNGARYSSLNHAAPGVPATATVSVSAQADLSIIKEDHLGAQQTPTAVEETPFTYFLTVTNHGPSDAQGVVVTDSVPAGVTLDSISFPQGSQGSGAVFNTFNLGTLAAGATVNGTVVVTFSEDGSVTDTASVSSIIMDPNLANNSSSVTDPVTEGTFTGTGLTLSNFEFTPLVNQPLATFTHVNGAEGAGAMTATISWGDGTSSAGGVALLNGSYTVTGSHTYSDEKTYSITVTVTDDSGSVTLNGTANIQEELLPGGTRGTADQRFLSEVYRDMLGRPIDPQGLATWTAALNSGASRNQVVRNIQNAPTLEYRDDQVQAIYHQYLHRAAEATALQNDAAFLQNGGTPEQLIDIVVSSPEYNQRTNGSNDGWLDVFYQDALGRAVDPAGRTGWDMAFAGGASRAQVAAQIMMDDEYRQDLIQSYYHQYLDRAAESAGLAAWLSAFKDFGATDDMVIAGIISAPEFYSKTAP